MVALQRVIQEDRTGCGFACVATIADTTYSRVKRMACLEFGWESRKVFYTGYHHLNRLLESLGCTTERGRGIKKWESLPDLAIVAINPDETERNWHWVVFAREGGSSFVIDPRSKCERRTDFWRMRLRSCIPVRRCK